MTFTRSVPDGRPAALTRELAASGHLSDPAWRTVFERVPRHRFLPDPIWAPDALDEDRWVPVPRSDPYWWDNAYVDAAVVTQVDDGEPAGPGGRGLVPTSAASQPSLVAGMLDALRARGDETVLEIGTATGYNCALLCERFGSRNVTSVEIDPVLGEQAAANLNATGYAPRLVVGDGALGVPERAPFDRVLATVAARRVPAAWITQTRPGGLVVTPWTTGYTSGVLVRLTVGDDGTASGPILGDAGFMGLRQERVTGGLWDFVDEDAPGVVDERIGFSPALLSDRDPGRDLVVGLLVPGLAYGRYDGPEGSGEATVYVYDRAGSWAVGEFTPGRSDYEARRYGPRDLWAEIEAAHTAWEAAGRPGRDRLGLTVATTGEHRLWVDHPENVLGT